MRVLAGDVGGTKTRLAIFEIGGKRLQTLLEKSYPSRQHPSLDALVEEFLALGAMPCAQACFGVAGPVLGQQVRVTNLPWVIDSSALAARFGFERVALINDLEANAWGIEALTGEDFCLLNPGRADAAGNASVIAAGTGLGEAGLFWDGRRYRPFASEGGHADFSAQSDLEIALLKYLRRQFGHASWERVVSGGGLVNIHSFLCEHRAVPVSDPLAARMAMGDAAAAISSAALEHSDPLCSEALDLFVHLYGAEAGNHALKIMARGGVYIGGGIAPKILPRLQTPLFMQAFLDKGRMRPLLEAMPVRVILNDRTALYGPALYLAAAGD